MCMQVAGGGARGNTQPDQALEAAAAPPRTDTTAQRPAKHHRTPSTTHLVQVKVRALEQVVHRVR